MHSHFSPIWDSCRFDIKIEGGLILGRCCPQTRRPSENHSMWIEGWCLCVVWSVRKWHVNGIYSFFGEKFTINPRPPLSSVTGLVLGTLIFSDFFVSGHSHACYYSYFINLCLWSNNILLSVKTWTHSFHYLSANNKPSTMEDYIKIEKIGEGTFCHWRFLNDEQIPQ